MCEPLLVMLLFQEATSDLPPGITMEEALELRETISKLELELEMVQQDVADKEDSIRRISRYLVQ